MKKFTITSQKSYTKNGEEKKTYPPVGKMTYFPATKDKKEGYILELNMFPDIKYYVFEDTPKEQNAPENAPQEAKQPLTDEQKQFMSVDEVASYSDVPFD